MTDSLLITRVDGFKRSQYSGEHFVKIVFFFFFADICAFDQPSGAMRGQKAKPPSNYVAINKS